MSNFGQDMSARRAAGSNVSVRWAGNPWALTGLCFLNILLIILTIGIYWFWARSEYRRRMWQMVRVNDEPLEYTGTGKELLIGYLKLFLFIILPAIILVTAGRIALGPKHPIVILESIIVYFGIFFLYFIGLFRAHRYILSRTRWRGIAFGLAGNATGYAWKSLWTGFLTGLTLGWILPWRTVALRRKLVSVMHFGSVPFRFEGSAGPLYLPFFFLWLIGIMAYGTVGVIAFQMARLQAQHPGGRIPMQELSPQAAVLGLVIMVAIPFVIIALSWFEARKLNLFARATKIGSLDTNLTASGASVLWLTVSNLFILLFSIGILRPVAQARRLKYLVTRFSLAGNADLDTVLRGSEAAGTQGAGLDAAFSIEIF